MSASDRSFDHTDHVQHRWRRFLNRDSKGYVGFSIIACGLHFVKVINSHTKNTGIAYLARRTAKHLPKLMMYPLVLGVPGAELLAWGASYLNHGKDNNSSKVARNATLVPAVFTVFGKTLNTVHPLVGRLRRLRGWFRPVKWGAIGLVLDNVVLRKLITARSESDDASQCEKDEKKVSFWKRHGPQ